MPALMQYKNILLVRLIPESYENNMNVTSSEQTLHIIVNISQSVK